MHIHIYVYTPLCTHSDRYQIEKITTRAHSSKRPRKREDLQGQIYGEYHTSHFLGCLSLGTSIEGFQAYLAEGHRHANEAAQQENGGLPGIGVPGHNGRLRVPLKGLRGWYKVGLDLMQHRSLIIFASAVSAVCERALAHARRFSSSVFYSAISLFVVANIMLRYISGI